MFFKELIRAINYEDVWKVLDREYHHESGAFEVYQRVLEELLGLQAEPNEAGITIVVAKVEDFSEPGTFVFEVFGVKEGDENRYAMEMSPWEDLLGSRVLGKSIELYGAAAVVAHVLYGMTFFGYSREEVAKRVDAEKLILTERMEELEAGNTKLLTSEEVMKSFGITDTRTVEEKELRQKEIERIFAENEKVYRGLLGEEK